MVFSPNFQSDSFFSCNHISFATTRGIWVTGCFKTSQLGWFCRWRGRMDTGDWQEVFYFSCEASSPQLCLYRIFITLKVSRGQRSIHFFSIEKRIPKQLWKSCRTNNALSKTNSFHWRGFWNSTSILLGKWPGVQRIDIVITQLKAIRHGKK